MCKHKFTVVVTEGTVVTFCPNCGEIAEVEAKPSIEIPECPFVRPFFPDMDQLNPYQDWSSPGYPWQYTFTSDGSSGTLTEKNTSTTSQSEGSNLESLAPGLEKLAEYARKHTASAKDLKDKPAIKFYVIG